MTPQEEEVLRLKARYSALMEKKQTLERMQNLKILRYAIQDRLLRP